MCCKTLLKNIYKRINAGKLWAIRLLKVPFQLLLIIIVICIVVKFFPDKIANFLGIKTDTGEIMSYIGEVMSFIELIIEGIFCVLVLKEFKMTRKSFEWQQKEQEEKKDKEICDKVKVIICSFLSMLAKFCQETKKNIGCGVMNKDMLFSSIEILKKYHRSGYAMIPQEVYDYIYNNFFEELLKENKIIKTEDFCNLRLAFEDKEQRQNGGEQFVFNKNLLLKQIKNLFKSNKQIEEIFNNIINVK